MISIQGVILAYFSDDNITLEVAHDSIGNYWISLKKKGEGVVDDISISKDIQELLDRNGIDA